MAQLAGSGGAAACSGTFSLDFNSYLVTSANPALVSRASVNAQYWFRDPAHPIAGTGGSAGVTFTLCP